MKPAKKTTPTSSVIPADQRLKALQKMLEEIQKLPNANSALTTPKVLNASGLQKKIDEMSQLETLLSKWSYELHSGNILGACRTFIDQKKEGITDFLDKSGRVAERNEWVSTEIVLLHLAKALSEYIDNYIMKYASVPQNIPDYTVILETLNKIFEKCPENLDLKLRKEALDRLIKMQPNKNAPTLEDNKNQPQAS